MKLAKALWGKNRHYKVADTHQHHFHTVAAQLGYVADMKDILQEVLQELPAAVDGVSGRLPEGFSDRVAALVLAGVQSVASSLARGG